MFKWIGEKVYNFVNNNLVLIFVLAGIGIVFAIIGHYGTMGFNWKWFLFFELPIYMFCGWAIYKTVRLFKKLTGNDRFRPNHY